MNSTPNPIQIAQLLNKKYLTLKDLNSFSDLLAISKLLSIINPRQILFHYVNSLQDIPTCICGKPLKWNSDKRKYREYCSTKCAAINTLEKRKLTSLEKFGVDHFSKTEHFNKKVSETSMLKYGVEHFSKTNQFQESVKSTNLEKFGVEFAAQSDIIKQKSIKTNLEKFGVRNPAQEISVQNKIINTNLEKYGVKNPAQSKTIRDKIAETNLKKYGVTNARSNLEISQRISNTRKKNYYSPEILALLNDPEWLKSQNAKGKSVGEIAHDLGVSSSNLCKYFEKFSIDIVRHWSSSHELKILKILDENNIQYEKNYRKLISPFELDIYIPTLRLAIEINGGFWHHEDAGKDKNYHINKYNSCKELGVELWNIFDWEIDSKFEIIKSKILNKIHCTSNKISARSLTISIVPPTDKTHFLETNHIQGPCSSTINIGLYKDNVIYALMTFGKSRFNKKYNWELLRYCTKLNHSIVGGASKLLTYFMKNYFNSGETLVSYCNLRFSSGNLYRKLQFQEHALSPPNYCYVTKNGMYAGSRNQWQKHMLKTKLKFFNPNLSEVENMKVNGYHRIWDCGNLVFTYSQ